MRFVPPEIVDLERIGMITTWNKGENLQVGKECTKGYVDCFSECKSTAAPIPQQRDTITHHLQECYGNTHQVLHLHTNLILLLSHSLLCA
jgi:hypothetical protein